MSGQTQTDGVVSDATFALWRDQYILSRDTDDQKIPESNWTGAFWPMNGEVRFGNLRIFFDILLKFLITVGKGMLTKCWNLLWTFFKQKQSSTGSKT